MVNLELDFDEGIILQNSDAYRCGENGTTLNELILSNKNIIYVYEKSNGLFKKPDLITEKIPLADIKVINGQAQVMICKNNLDEKGIQILLTNGHREFITFNISPKKTMPIWVDAINKAIVGEVEPVKNTEIHIQSSTEPAPKEKRSILGGLSGALSGALNLDIQSVVEKAQSKIAEFPQQVVDKVQSKYEDNASEENTVIEPETPIVENVATVPQTETNVEVPPIPQSDSPEKAHTFCSNCGTKLNAGAKFCHGCGSAVGVPIQQNVEPTPPKSEVNRTERQQEYVGKILKCPNCGGVINETTAICPECGMRITGKTAVLSIQEFKEQLMEIENSRKKTFGGIFSIYATADPADKKKLTLIKNFPIPNSIDDCLEFMMLAIANIDVNLSKKTWANSGQSKEILSIEMPKAISNAWVAKMEQVYKKAEIVFPNDPAFAGIQKIYFEKMKELKIKLK